MIQTIESREVAKMIGYSRHDNLLQKIDTIIFYMRKSPDLKVKVGEYFIESEYHDDNNQLRKCYLVTKVGCELLGSRIQGEQGTNFSARYVAKFNEQLPVTKESSTKIQLQALLAHEEKLEQIESDITVLKQEIDLTRKQKAKLSKLVRMNVMKAVGGKKSHAYESLYRVAIAEHWRTIKNYFEVSSYEEIPKLRFDEALELAECWQPSAELAMEIKRANQVLMLA